MRIAYKQLTRQVLQNNVFLTLLFLLTILTSLSFFFVRFTIDGNQNRLEEIAIYGGDMDRYQTATASNTILAYMFLLTMSVLTAFVFVLFFYRFFRSGQRTIGCLRALGFRNGELRCFFVLFVMLLSLCGAMLGLVLGYPLSNILLQANQEAYGVQYLVQQVSPASVCMGVLAPTAIFSLVAFFCYGFVGPQEPGNLMGGMRQHGSRYSKPLEAANWMVERLPVKNKFSLRIALRKPLAVLLVLVAVVSFSTCMILAYSLNQSSGKVMASQTQGHHYAYETRYPAVMEAQTLPENAVPMLRVPVTIVHNQREISWTAAGIDDLGNLYQLLDHNETPLPTPEPGTAIIHPALREVYGIKPGDTLTLLMEQTPVNVQVSDIAVNAQAATLYLSIEDATHGIGALHGSYNTMLTQTLPANNGGACVSSLERTALLERDAVSNKISGVINQVIGAVVGSILLFLALYMNFQDNMGDMFILDMMGYGPKAIRRMLMDVYRPLLWGLFVLTLPAAIFLVQNIQRSLSITTGDYMPFGTSISVLLLTAFGLTLIYQMVQWVFHGSIKRIIAAEDIARYTGAE